MVPESRRVARLLLSHPSKEQWADALRLDNILQKKSPATARRDEQTKFQLYRDEGVTWYVLVYPAAAKAMVYRLVDGDYRKVGDFHDERQDFELSRCTIAFDFGRLWRERGAADPIAP